MAYDYSKLLGRITEKFGTQARFSGAMGMSERSLSLKLNSKVPFKQSRPARGAWVEIRISPTETAGRSVAPRKGRVD